MGCSWRCRATVLFEFRVYSNDSMQGRLSESTMACSGAIVLSHWVSCGLYEVSSARRTLAAEEPMPRVSVRPVDLPVGPPVVVESPGLPGEVGKPGRTGLGAPRKNIEKSSKGSVEAAVKGSDSELHVCSPILLRRLN